MESGTKLAKKFEMMCAVIGQVGIMLKHDGHQLPSASSAMPVVRGLRRIQVVCSRPRVWLHRHVRGSSLGKIAMTEAASSGVPLRPGGTEAN